MSLLSSNPCTLLPNNQRQHRTLHIQKDVLPYELCKLLCLSESGRTGPGLRVEGSEISDYDSGFRVQCLELRFELGLGLRVPDSGLRIHDSRFRVGG